VFQAYYLPQSVQEALDILSKYNGQAAIIAGGTDIVLDIQEGKKSFNAFVDVSRIPDLQSIGEENGYLRLGASVTHSQANRSALVQAAAPILAEACGKVGSLQIRNIATLVGNVVNAQPAADAAVALAALGAKAVIEDGKGRREALVEALYADVGKSLIDPAKEIVTALLVPVQKKRQGSAFVRLDQRKALALPMLNVAAVVQLDEKGERFEWARIIMAPVGPGPVRGLEGEALLTGAAVSREAILEAAKAAVKQANPRSSALRGSREYRMGVLPVLVKRALEAAVEQAKRTDRRKGESQ
jgi:carbon-monoxide dehydrogenase medium subunit